jgi:hypothetical protein
MSLGQPLILPGLEFMEILGAEVTGDRIKIMRLPADLGRYGYSIDDIGLKAPDGTVVWGGFGVVLHTGERKEDHFMLSALDPAFDPADYTLVIRGERPERVISGEWTVSFDNLQTVTPRTLTGQTAGGQTISISCGATRTTVTITPGYAQDSAGYKRILSSVLWPDSANPAFTLTLRDGTVIAPNGNSVIQPGVYVGDTHLEFPFITPFLLPQELLYITWMGENYDF